MKRADGWAEGRRGSNSENWDIASLVSVFNEKAINK